MSSARLSAQYHQVKGEDPELHSNDDRHPAIGNAQLEPSWRTGFILLLALYFASVLIVVIKDPGFTFKHRSTLETKHPVVVPEPVLRTTVFMRNVSFENATIWDKLAPDTLGYIGISDPSRYGLERGWPIDGTHAEAYSIALFHQLRCLTILREGFQELWEGNNLPMMDNVYHHCFDYLRQSTLCTADTTVEPFAIIHNMLAEQVDGWGVRHTCRDWEAVYAFAKEHDAFSGHGTNID